MGYRASDHNRLVIGILMLIIVICFFVYGIVYIIKAGTHNDKLHQERAVAVDVFYDNFLQDDLEIVCVEGHTYYFWSNCYKYFDSIRAMIAPKLNDDGTPVKCIVEKEKELK